MGHQRLRGGGDAGMLDRRDDQPVVAVKQAPQHDVGGLGRARGEGDLPGSHLSRFATRSRACSTAAAAARPVACSVAWGLAATSCLGSMASTTLGSCRFYSCFSLSFTPFSALTFPSLSFS